mgnify:CR=1 FL=1
MAEETFKVNTEEEVEDKSVKVEQNSDIPEDGIVFDTSTGRGMDGTTIPEKMRAPATQTFETYPWRPRSQRACKRSTFICYLHKSPKLGQ